MKEKRLGYIDMCKDDLKRFKNVCFYSESGSFVQAQTKSIAKSTAKRWSKVNKIEYKVYEIILREVKEKEV